MSSPSNPQHEPTMEEILASIRKIISEDQSEPAKPAPAPAPPPPVQVKAPEPDVLDLTEEIAEPVPVQPVAVAVENDVMFETIEDRPEPGRGSTAMDEPDDLISDSTRSAVHSVFDGLDDVVEEPVQPLSMPPSGNLDALFAHAIQTSFGPTLQQWVDSHSGEILEGLKPLIRGWMDEHLPSLIEAAVQKEISRAVASRRKR